MTTPLTPDSERLLELFAGHEPADLRQYIATLTPGVPYVTGSAVRAITGGGFRAVSSGLIVPATARTGAAPGDYLGTYVTLREYGFELDLPPGMTVPSGAAIEMLASRVSTRQLLSDLATLAYLVNSKPSVLADLQRAFEANLLPRVQERFRAAMTSGPGGAIVGRQLVSPQGILHAMRVALVRPEPDEESVVAQAESWLRAVLLVHAIADELDSDRRTSKPPIAAMPEGLFMEILQNQFFYQVEDTVALLDRYVRLWTVYGPQVRRVRLRASPHDLLIEATGLEALDIVALAFAMWAHQAQWSPAGSLWQTTGFNSDMDRSKVEGFLRLVSRTPEELRASLEAQADVWDFLQFQKTPVLRMGEELLVLDSRLLLDLATAGLFWRVHDQESSRSGDEARLSWAQAYGEMFELMALDSLRGMAVPIIGTGTSSYTTEDELLAVYGTKSCDGAISYGRDVLLAEVVSGRLTLLTRVRGSREAFEADTEKIILKKARQLDSIGRAILANEQPLTGITSGTAGLQLFPVVVAAEGYPVSPATMTYILEELARTGLLSDPRFEEISIIDFGELEMLEGLAERGEIPTNTLHAWKGSPLRHMPLRNFLIDREPQGTYRPSRMAGQLHELQEEMISRLQLRS